MYRVYCDGLLLYHSNLELLKIFNPSVELELNKTGSFEFTIYPNHPYYNSIHKLKSIITVFQDDFILFRGRVLDDEVGWHNEKMVVCEGELAFLLDSIQRPVSFTGTVAEFMAHIINSHNSQVGAEKQFTLGSVTVEGNLTADLTEYTDSFETLQKQLLEGFGGYLRTRQEDGINYLDYLAEINLLSPQSIQFGKNLLDLKRISKGADIATAVIPLGKDGLTIASVNNGLDYIVDEDAQAQYGLIVKTVNFADIEDATELMVVGQAYLADSVNQWETIELTAADLATVDKTITSFHLGTQVRAKSKPHGLDHLFLVSKLSIKLLDPGANKMTLGKTIRAFSEAVKGISDGQGLVLQEVKKNAQAAAEAVYNVERNLLASIQVSEQNIQSVVSEKYYLKDETEALVSSVSTEIEQTKNSVELQFNQFSADVAAVAAGADAEFEEIKKYIRFVDGQILLGEVGNELELNISNDRISFLQDGAEVAYFSNRKLYVTDANIVHSLQLGNFAFMPRANGNLSFKKV
jgi:hypothetical protein